jgi:hypothetical protein
MPFTGDSAAETPPGASAIWKAAEARGVRELLKPGYFTEAEAETDGVGHGDTALYNGCVPGNEIAYLADRYASTEANSAAARLRE